MRQFRNELRLICLARVKLSLKVKKKCVGSWIWALKLTRTPWWKGTWSETKKKFEDLNFIHLLYYQVFKKVFGATCYPSGKKLVHERKKCIKTGKSRYRFLCLRDYPNLCLSFLFIVMASFFCLWLEMDSIRYNILNMMAVGLKMYSNPRGWLSLVSCCRHNHPNSLCFKTIKLERDSFY